MKKVLFMAVLGFAALVLADGYETVDDFGGVMGDEGFWDVSKHAERQVHSRTVAVPFDLSAAPTSETEFDVFDSRVYTSVFGVFLGEFSTKPNGLFLLLR